MIHEIMRGWNTWVEYSKVRRDKLAMVRLGLLHLILHHLSMGWRSWTAWYWNTLRLRDLVNDALRRLKARELNGAVRRWQELLPTPLLPHGVPLPPPPEPQTGQPESPWARLCEAARACLKQ